MKTIFNGSNWTHKPQFRSF